MGTLLAVVRETLTGIPKAGNAMTEGFKSKLHGACERIRPKVFSPFDRIRSTLFEIFFLLFFFLLLDIVINIFYLVGAFITLVLTTLRCYKNE